eukprot:9489210-Pyramimonas_sp.AAC.1
MWTTNHDIKCDMFEHSFMLSGDKEAASSAFTHPLIQPTGHTFNDRFSPKTHVKYATMYAMVGDLYGEVPQGHGPCHDMNGSMGSEAHLCSHTSSRLTL